jgi:hypothetical protein
MMPPTPGRAAPPPLLEGGAAAAIAAARARLGYDQPRPRFPAPDRHLTEQERAEAQQEAKNACHLCGGLHPLPSSPACPRVAEFETTSDGRTVVKGRFWQDGEWDASRVLFLTDAAEEPAEDTGEGNDRG